MIFFICTRLVFRLKVKIRIVVVRMGNISRLKAPGFDPVRSLGLNSISRREIDINKTFRRYSSISCRGINFSSKRNSILYATDILNSSLKPRPVLLHYFVMHTFNCNGIAYQHLLAAVSWLKEHPAKNYYEKPLEVWWKDLVDYDHNMFIPVQLLICHAVHSDIKHEEQTVFLVCPVQNIPAIV